MPHRLCQAIHLLIAMAIATPTPRRTGLKTLTHDLQAEFGRTGAQVGGGKVRHVAPVGQSRPEQVSSLLPSRLILGASAPEFGESLGKRSALVVTGSSGGRTRRQIHQIAAECVAGVVVREDGLDSAAVGA